MNPRVEKARPIFDMIISHEAPMSAARAQGRSSQFDVVWSGINRCDYTRKPISQLTVAQVLHWQDILDPKYRSEAAGALQFMEDTLRSLHFDPDALFNEETQLELGLQLLDRRGWSQCEAGVISPETFANNLAKEWASLPVVHAMRGARRPVQAGQSYYAGDGLNRAYAKPSEVLGAIHAALALGDVPKPAAPVAPAPTPGLGDLEDLELEHLANVMEWIGRAPAKSAPEAELRAWRSVMPEVVA